MRVAQTSSEVSVNSLAGRVVLGRRTEGDADGEMSTMALVFLSLSIKMSRERSCRRSWWSICSIDKTGSVSDVSYKKARLRMLISLASLRQC